MQDRVLTAVDVHRDALAKQQAASASQIATAVQETQAARRELQEVEAAWAAAARGLENERNRQRASRTRADTRLVRSRKLEVESKRPVELAD